MADSQKKSAQLFSVTDYTNLTVQQNGSAINLTKTVDTVSFDSNATSRFSGFYCTNFINSIDNYDSTQNYYISARINSDISCDIRWVVGDNVITLIAGNNDVSYYGTLSSFVCYIIEAEAHIVISKIMVSESQHDYEPYNSTGWQHSLRKLTTATEAVENPLYSDGTAITAYTIKGNTVQDGTPTPSNPVEISGVGVRTENLAHDISITYATTAYSNALLFDADLKPNTTYTLSFISVSGLELYTNENLFTSEVIFTTVDGLNTITITTVSEISKSTTAQAQNGLWRILKNRTSLSITPVFDNVMFNTGNTAKPYEPYGYKIPISSGGVTTNIYLGSTQTVRQIKKMVLTGQEDWMQSSSYTFYIPYSVNDYLHIKDTICVSSHYVAQINVDSGDYIDYGTCCFYYGKDEYGADIYILYLKNITAYSTVADFKAYLAQQYANGTPVTVWYVLATPETAAVNEPLMKIGDYADTLSNAAQIPTTEGANSITVDTTVQPSEFTATWTGWHDASVKKYTPLLPNNPLCGIDTYKDTLNLATGACTRAIKKLVLTGEENWGVSSGTTVYYVNDIVTDYLHEAKVICVCTHYKTQINTNSATNIDNNTVCFRNSSDRLYINSPTHATTTDFTTFLQQQYSAGTPVTLWYVLATPTTETITVPTGLSGTEEGYLTQSSTPTPTNPVYPTANDVPVWE